MRRLFSGLLILVFFAIPALAQDAPPSDTSGVTVTEVAQLDRRTGPGNTSAHLSPDGQRILHIDRDTFCLLTLTGEEEACYTLSEQTGLHAAQVAPDHDTVTWSPDGRFVAYTVEGWTRGNDMDILLFAANTGQLTNLTDDGYDGKIFGISDDIPDTAFLDYAPAWKPDGTLTFARNSASNPRRPAELWSLSLGDSEPVKVAELHPDEDELGTVMSMDWSADGGTLAYTLYHSGDRSGLWLYDAATGQTEMLLVDDRQERGNAMRATFSPDASQILLLTSEREQFVTDQVRDGHFIVSAETGEATRLDPETWVMSAGWLPDGSGLIYSGRSARFTEQGVYVSGDPSQAGRLVLTGTLGEDDAPYNVYAPTNRVRSALNVSPDGTMLLGTSVAQALIVTRVDGFGPIPVQTQAALEAQTSALAEFDPASVTVTEVARLDRSAGFLERSALLSPDGEHILHISHDVFCLLTIRGEEEWCVSALEETGLHPSAVAPDHDSIAWSPDGRFVAFTTMGLVYGTDTDIWALLVDEQRFFNVTDDGYDGPIVETGDREIPEDVYVDLAPVWMPDGTLTFARHSLPLQDNPAQLWAGRENDSEPHMVTDLFPNTGEAGFVLSMDWSADGQTMAYIVDPLSEHGGLWLYDAASGETERLVAGDSEIGRFLRATLSPDGSQILLLTDERDQSPRPSERDGHFVVSTETGEYVRLDPDVSVESAGWLPDGADLIYSERTLPDGEAGVYVSGDPAGAGHLVLTGTLGKDGPYHVRATVSDNLQPLRVGRDGLMLLGTRVIPPVLIVTRVEGFGPVPLQAQTAPEATALPMVTDIPRVTVEPSITETPVPEANAQGAFTAVREVARLPISSVRNASSHLMPNGETLINVQGNVFCEYTLEGAELWCVEAVYNDGDEDRQLPVDQETVTMSPDGRYLAFTTDALRLFRDPDIWVLDLETQQLANLTDDGYDGSMASTDDSSVTAHIDLAPAWRPDGMLTFARHSPGFNDAAPSLWMVDPAGGEPEKLADFEATFDALNLVMDMDWSPDGSKMAFVLDSQGNPFGGLWLYEVEGNDMRPLVVPPEREGFLTAEFSPDGQSILLLTVMHASVRAISMTGAAEDNGYFVVSLDGSTQKAQAPLFMLGTGWLPDGSLLYLLYSQDDPASGGVFIAPSASEQPEKVMDLPTLEDRENATLFAPTARQWAMINATANGRFVLGSTEDVSLVIEAYGDQTAQAASVPSATETPVPETSADLGPVSLREVARLDLLTGPAATSSRLLPDGETLIHAQMNEICAYTLAGAEQWCVEIVQHFGDNSGRVRIDPESITMSVDGRYLAFTTDALMTFRDPDIWVLDMQERQYSNLTEDRYDGSMMLSNDIPDTANFDLAPAWRPDGMLTFARHTHNMSETIPSLWMVDPEGGAPEKLADFEGLPGNLNLVMSMDWSPDGSRMTFVLDNMSNPFGGLWLYEADKDNMKPLVIPPEDEPGFLRADFSPDGESILLMTALREMERSRDLSQVPERTGYFVVSADTGRVTPVQADSVIMGIGWLPDSRLIYAGNVPVAPENGGFFVVPAGGGETVKVMDMLEHDGEPLIAFSPTPRQWAPIEIGANGRFVLGTAHSVTPVLEATAE